jgi:gliding motility-associated-like protein
MRSGLCFLLFVLFAVPLRSQTNTYVLNGTATQDNCNCYTLTTATNFANGSVWNATKIDLSSPFDFSFNVNLGCKDSDGADGIVFILQTVATSIGGAGGGMGFLGVTPSIGITLDTWQNIDYNDPAFDHISIQLNGNLNHGTDLAGPIVASTTSDNIEDCQWHILRIKWDPATKIISTYFDGAFRLQATIDLINTVFSNHTDVFWGFSSATGGANNVQKFCTSLNPGFNTSLPNNTGCIDDNIVTMANTSVSFAPIASYYWNFGDGNFSTDPNPPPHAYTVPGIYKVKLAITGLDGCRSDTLEKTVVIGDYPVANFDVFDTCSGRIPRIQDQSTLSVGTITQWNWYLDGRPVSTAQHPQLADLDAISYTLQLEVTSQYGCTSTSGIQQFEIKKTPHIKAEADGACVNVPVQLSGEQMDNATWITGWTWNLGTNRVLQGQNITYTFTQPGNYTVQLTATADNGCVSDPAIVPITIIKPVAFAGNDTVVIKNQPFQLHGTGGGAYSWTPPLGLDDPGSPNPIAILQDDRTYKLNITTDEGCIADDMIQLTVFKGSDIWMPTGFTPNDDGRNDILKPEYKGIKTLKSFSVYNRWGQLIFTTTNIWRGWNGTVNGVKQGTGVFVWQIRAVDYVGKVYELDGTSTLIR